MLREVCCMIHPNDLQNARENNRLEAKSAMGGLPQSIWETYSAFANAEGGIILLGVEEHEDKSLHTVNLPDPEEMIAEFLHILHMPGKVSVNLLTEERITIEKVDGNRIIIIRVPEAAAIEKPVYLDGNPLTGTYLRCGEGDYRCSAAEVEAMQQAAAVARAQYHMQQPH